MISYQECEYSLFISYAHADDRIEYGWVSSLRKAIRERLEGLDDSIPKKGLHLSHENGPVAGTLGFELNSRVAKSFGMLLVVGEKYVDSNWCEKELKYFYENFGEEGLKSRLYIAVMSEKALRKAEKGEYWKKLMPEDLVWVKMFDDTTNRPLNDVMENGSLAVGFRNQAAKIADRLIKEIQNDDTIARSKGNETVNPFFENNTQLINCRDNRKKVLIAPHTTSLAQKVEKIKATLEYFGSDVTVLSQAFIDVDLDDGLPLRPLLTNADFLISPLTLERPLQQNIVGGHTAVLKHEWAAAGKEERNLIWYRPSDLIISPEALAAEKHIKFFNELTPLCVSEEALMNYIFRTNIGATLQVHIENHSKAHAFWRLSRELEDAWATLPADPTRPMLRCVPFNLKNVTPNKAPKDVAGVVLLLPIPLKDFGSLRDQMEMVERFIPKAGTYPGCVVVLYKPPLNPDIPMENWPYVEVKQSEKEPKFIFEEDSKIELQEFLLQIWERYRASLSRPLAA